MRGVATGAGKGGTVMSRSGSRNSERGVEGGGGVLLEKYTKIWGLRLWVQELYIRKVKIWLLLKSTPGEMQNIITIVYLSERSTLG